MPDHAHGIDTDRIRNKSASGILVVEDAVSGLPDGKDVPAWGASSEGSTGFGLDIRFRIASSNGSHFYVVPAAFGGAEFRLELAWN